SIEKVVKLIRKEPHKNLLVRNASELDKVASLLKSDDDLEEVFISGQLLSNPKLHTIIDDCEDQGIEIKILPDLLEMRLGEIMVDDSLDLPILHLKPLSLHGLRFAAKRCFDLSLSIFI